MNSNTNTDLNLDERFSNIKSEGRTVLTLPESRDVLDYIGIPLNKFGEASDLDAVLRLGKEMGYPVVMKIVSEHITHKTDVGGVKVNIGSERELQEAYEDMMRSVRDKCPDAKIDGVSLEEMVKGTELIIGTTTDPQFKQMIMFGIGGIFVEVYKDVSFRLAPVTKGDAFEMINEIKGKQIFGGIRGMPKADPEQLVDILMKISNLVIEHPEITEMDINPLMVTERGVIAVDARIMLG